MINPIEIEIVPGVIFYAYYSSRYKEKAWFVEHNTLVMQVSGRFELETSSQSASIEKGQIILVRKNQLAQLTKNPMEEGQYQTIVVFLQEEMLRTIALEEQIPEMPKYSGTKNIIIPGNDYLRGFFLSVAPYVQNPERNFPQGISFLKVREAVQLLLQAMPQLREFLFDFSDPYKVDLEKFMHSNYHFNVPIEKFARLTGRSLAGFKRDFQKVFNQSPRQWLQEKRLNEALYLIEKKHLKPSSIYLDLGFESLSHFSHSFKKKFGKSPSNWVAV